MNKKELLLKIKAEAQRGKENNPYQALRNIYEIAKVYEKNTRYRLTIKYLVF